MRDTSDMPLRLHSARDPHREAERFVRALDGIEDAAVVIVTEPGDSYLAKAFKDANPALTLVAIRYTDDLFLDSDVLWDAVWRPSSLKTLFDFLVGLLPEEILGKASFIPWKPSDAMWPSMSRSVWDTIAAAVRALQSSLRTRAHFGRSWLWNSVTNAILARRTVRCALGSRPIIVCASGPSLERLMPLRTRDLFTVIALSSSLPALSRGNLVPDIAITTDGGFWARSHLARLPDGVPLAFPLEAAVPVDVLRRNPSLVLDYGSSLESTLLALSGLSGTRTEQSTTVAGTGIVFALSHSSCIVNAAGLDLAAGTGLSHCRPHAFDALLDSAQSRLVPLSAQYHERSLRDSSLAIYAKWFQSQAARFKGRLVRVNPSHINLEGIASIAKGELEASATQGGVKEGARFTAETPQASGSISRWIKDAVTALSDDLPSLVRDYRHTGIKSAELSLMELVAFQEYLIAVQNDYRDVILSKQAREQLIKLADRAGKLESRSIYA